MPAYDLVSCLASPDQKHPAIRVKNASAAIGHRSSRVIRELAAAADGLSATARPGFLDRWLDARKVAKTKDNDQLMSWLGRCTLRCVDSKPFATQKLLNEAALTERFLEFADEASFTPLFHLFTPQLLAFYRARGCETALAEDLAQEVMLTVYLKAGQIRDRASFRAWLFRIARNTLCRHYGKRARAVDIVDIEDAIERVPASQTGAGHACIRIHELDGASQFSRARHNEAPIHRRVGIPRDRYRQIHSHWNGPVASL